jgi:hypothetical protein
MKTQINPMPFVCRPLFQAAGLALILSAFHAMAASPAKPAAESSKPSASSTETAVVTNATFQFNFQQSYFAWNPANKDFGRDPFFPTSTRFKPAAPPPPPPPTNATPATTTNVTPPPPPPPPVPEPTGILTLKLEGLLGSVLAIINGRDLKLGQEIDITIAPAGKDDEGKIPGNVRLKLLEINTAEKSVMVRISGPPQPVDVKLPWKEAEEIKLKFKKP